MLEIIKANFSNIISLCSLVISILMLRIYVKNRKLTKAAYYHAVNEYMDSDTQLRVVNREQIDNEICVRLAVYNLNNKPIFIHCLSVAQEKKRRGLSGLLFSKTEMQVLEGCRWWPNPDSDSNEAKYFHEKYESLIVKDIMIVQINIPGFINRERYCFELQTNRGYVKETTTIDGFNSSFPIVFQKERHYGRKLR